VSSPESRTLLVATTNPNKVAEIGPILSPALNAIGLTLRSLPPDAPPVTEGRPTFSGNAALKALAASGWSGEVALGEDSGLEVDALGGAPGVLSARYSGGGPAENNKLLLERLGGVPRGRRGARFRTAVALKVPDGPLFLAEGMTEGEITGRPRGSGGFGYDPVFLSRDLGRTFAEVSRDEKARVSHRSRALRALRGYLFEAFAAQDFQTPRGPLPGLGTCLEALQAAECPPGLVRHQLAVGRLGRELALSLAEAGVPADAKLAAAAGLLHDVGRSLPHAGGNRLPCGVTGHAWLSAQWMAGQGFDPRLARAVLVHGLDSLLVAKFRPSTWEERILILVDKLVEEDYVGLAARLTGLRRRYPASRRLITACRRPLRELEAQLASACRLTAAEMNRRLAAVLEVVSLTL
jgi:XTP/dITP diphosphohydrolase